MRSCPDSFAISCRKCDTRGNRTSSGNSALPALPLPGLADFDILFALLWLTIAAALLFVLGHHPGGKPLELDAPGLEPAGEVGILQGGAHLLAERQEEAVVQRGKRVPTLPGQQERAHRLLSPEYRERREIAAAFVSGHLDRAPPLDGVSYGGGRGVGG